MAEDWNAAAADIAEGIEGVGMVATIVRSAPSTGPAYNPTPGVPIEAPCKVMYGDWTDNDRERLNIQASDKKVYMASSGFTIAANSKRENANKVTVADKFRDTTGEYIIQDVNSIAPDGITVLLWELQIRG